MKLIHNGQRVIMLFDAPDISMSTGQTVFEGSITECKAEIERLGLDKGDDDRYLVERIFKAPSDVVKNGKMPILPSKDVLPMDVLHGKVIKEQDGYTYMRCGINQESLYAMLDNSTSGELDGVTIVDLDIAGSFVGVSEVEI